MLKKLSYNFILSTVIIFMMLMFTIQGSAGNVVKLFPYLFLIIRLLEAILYYTKFKRIDEYRFISGYRWFIILIEYPLVIFPLINVLTSSDNVLPQILISVISLFYLSTAYVCYRYTKKHSD